MDPQYTKHIPALDGMRGVAVILVVAYHFFERFVPFGWCGVDLFFVLSGFLITGILWDTRRTAGYYPRFVMRRALRILPLYFTVLGAITLFALVFRNTETQETLQDQAWYWTFTSNFRFAFRGWPHGWHVLDHFWSLAIEEQFYLVWPWLVLWIGRAWLLRVALLGILLSFTIRWCYPISPFAYVFTLARLDPLLLGSSVALMMRGDKQHDRRYLPDLLMLAAAFIILSAMLLDGSAEYSGPWMIRIGYSALAFLFATWLWTVVAVPGMATISQRVLTRPWLRDIGKYSYGIYIYHFVFAWFLKVVLKLVAPYTTTWSRTAENLGFALLAVFTYFFARLSYERFEKRFLGLKARFAPKPISKGSGPVDGGPDRHGEFGPSS